MVVDRLTKMAHFIPCTKIVTEEETVRLFLDNIYHLHGLPNDIVLDRGTQIYFQFLEKTFSATWCEDQSFYSVSSTN
jgi:hypothetical protein